MRTLANNGAKATSYLESVSAQEFVTFWNVTRGRELQDQRWQSMIWGKEYQMIRYLE